MKTGLVLEGGAMRGLFTAGILDVMMENDIQTDGLIGVSAGACFGCNVKSRQIGRAIRYNRKYSKDWHYCSFRSLILTGDLYGADFCYHQMPEKLDPFDKVAFARNPMAFYLVCTDVDTGKAVYHRCDRADDECMEWIRASASMPLVSRAVEVGGYRLLDGGIADSIPLSYFQSIGYERNIVILTQPEGYRKQPTPLLPLLKRALKKYPMVAETLAHRHEVYNRTTDYIRQQEAAGTVLVLRPEEPLEIGHMAKDEQAMQRVYLLGRAMGEKRLEELRSFAGQSLAEKP